MAAYLKDSLNRKVIFFTGKGGVGKTTLAWATALLCRREGLRVRVAHCISVEGSIAHDPALLRKEGIDLLALEPMECFREYAIQIVKFEKIYQTVFDNRILKTFLLAAPGLADTVMAGKIWDLYDKKEQDLLIVDLPSTGHSLTFFGSPLGVQKIFPIGFVHREAEKICQLFRSKESRVDLVALPQELPLTESIELKTRLEKLYPFHFGFLHLGQTTPTFAIPENAPLPLSVQALCAQYLDLKQQEQESLSLAGKVDLPMIQIPRMALENESDLIRSVSQRLGNA